MYRDDDHDCVMCEGPCDCGSDFSEGEGCRTCADCSEDLFGDSLQDYPDGEDMDELDEEDY